MYISICCFAIVAISSAGIGLIACEQDENSHDNNEQSPYLQAVQVFADQVLENGRDRYGNEHSPLFADGIDVESGEPMRWHYNGNSWVVSNFASQQNLMRVFIALTELTGDARYREAAEDAARYMFEHQTDSAGLLYWGGHQFVDLETLENQFESRPHELKNNFPFYEFLWDVNPDAARRLLQAMWNTHILNWEVLDLNRHGEYDMEMGPLWDHEFDDPEPFFEGRGLTFINAGTDMIQAAMALYALGGEEGAREWGMRLYEQYVRARHPDTGLGVYQYSQPIQRNDPPPEGPLEGELTFSGYGDRAKNQFGQVYGDIALEGNVLWGGRVSRIYGQSAVMTLHLAEQLRGTDAGEKLLGWTLDGLKALARHSYFPEENHFRPMWADGTDLTGEVYPRTGYYGREGTEFASWEPDGPMVLSFVRGVRLSEGDHELWDVIRHVFIASGLGDPGNDINDTPSLNFQTEESSADFLVAVLEMKRATGRAEYVELAERIGDNILTQNFHNGFFQPSADHVYARFDDPEPLALLLLEAARMGDPELVPPYLTGTGVTDGEYEGLGRITDDRLYGKTR